MSARKESAAIVGVGVAACAVCCAGPILAVLGAIGLGTAAGFALFGTFAILIGATVATVVLVRRRGRGVACASTDSPEPVRVELTNVRARS